MLMACGFATQVVHLKEFMMTNSGKALDNKELPSEEARLRFLPFDFSIKFVKCSRISFYCVQVYVA
jgi:hypothetical protein